MRYYRGNDILSAALSFKDRHQATSQEIRKVERAPLIDVCGIHKVLILKGDFRHQL
jgi:hypothetical protein